MNDKTSLIVQYSYWHESNRPSSKKFIILHIDGHVDMDVIYKEIEKTGKLSPFRRDKEITIYSIQQLLIPIK